MNRSILSIALANDAPLSVKAAIVDSQNPAPAASPCLATSTSWARLGAVISAPNPLARQQGNLLGPLR